MEKKIQDVDCRSCSRNPLSICEFWGRRTKDRTRKAHYLQKNSTEVCALRFVQLTSYYTFKKSHCERFWNSYLFEAVCVFLCDTVFWCVLLFVRVDGCVSHVWAHTKIAETAKKKKKKKLSICFCHVFFIVSSSLIDGIYLSKQ